MMFPKPQSGIVWPSIVVYNANNNGGSIFGYFGFFRALRTHKMAIKLAKMAILGPNLKNAVPKTSEWAKLTQYSTFQCQQWWWGPFGQKDISGGPYKAQKYPLQSGKASLAESFDGSRGLLRPSNDSAREAFPDCLYLYETAGSSRINQQSPTI